MLNAKGLPHRFQTCLTGRTLYITWKDSKVSNLRFRCGDGWSVLYFLFLAGAMRFDLRRRWRTNGNEETDEGLSHITYRLTLFERIMRCDPGGA